MNNNVDIAKRILFPNEAAELLNISKQHLSYLTNNKKIPILKRNSKEIVYLKDDIVSYLLKNNYDDNSLKDYSGSTFQALKFFREHYTELGEINHISLYFNEIDAIYDQRYGVSKTLIGPNLFYLDVPHMIINGSKRDMWLWGVNCGYGGTGPSGSKKLLEEIGVPVDDRIMSNSMIDCKKINGEWKIIANDDRTLSTSITKWAINYATRKNKLILIVRDCYFDEIGEILKVMSKFLVNPRTVYLFSTSEEAKENGFYIFNSFEPIYCRRANVFHVIIEATNGNQIWFPFYFDQHQSVYDDIQIKDVLKYCGFDVDSISVKEKLSEWLNIKVFCKKPNSKKICI